MLTAFVYNIPIFDYKLGIVIYDKWEEVGNTLFDDGIRPKAITREEYGASLVGIENGQVRSIPHESEHVKNNLWRYIGYSPQRDNDEVDAYVVAYIARKILHIYYKHVASKGLPDTINNTIEPINRSILPRVG